jgi:hypothetical protein
MQLTSLVRGTIFVAACAALAASASSSQNTQPSMVGGYSNPPPPVAMAPTQALGLWKSSFGAVKIEDDLQRGAPGSGNLQGVWVSQRNGQEVIGYFAGTMRGNVFEFQWQEPGQPMLIGQGYLAFNPSGQSFSGRWWSERRDRVGDWTGWRSPPPPQYQPATDPN